MPFPQASGSEDTLGPQDTLQQLQGLSFCLAYVLLTGADERFSLPDQAKD